MKRTILYCIASSIILLIVSFYFNDRIFDFILSFFEGGHLQFVVHEFNSPFLAALKLSVSIGIIPLLLLIVLLAGQITSYRKRLFSVLIIVGCIALAIMMNVFRISSYEIEMTKLPAQITFPFEELFFEYAIAIGSILGSAISYFIFRKRKSNEELNLEIKASRNN